MPKLLLTSKQQKFIKNNYQSMTGNQMAIKFGVSRGVVNRYKRIHGLTTPFNIIVDSRSKIQSSITSSTRKIDNYLKNNYLIIPSKRIASNINRSNTFVRTRLRQLCLIVPVEIIEKFKKESQIKPGAIPHNKGKKMLASLYEKVKHTFFKNGNIPGNTLYDGAIVIRQSHPVRNEPPYKWIRLSLGKWVMLHRYVWIQKYGTIPTGMCVAFKNGDSMNCDISNLELITREENMKRNTIHNYPKEIVDTIMLRGRLNKQINKLEKYVEK